MAQREILLFLEENKGKKYTSNELAEALGLNKKQTTRAISKLFKYKQVKSEDVKIGYHNRLRIWL